MELTTKQKAAFGIGAVGKDMVYALSASYVMYYYQDVLGLSATFVGLILMIARVFDAFNDPFMGVGRQDPHAVGAVPAVDLFGHRAQRRGSLRAVCRARAGRSRDDGLFQRHLYSVGRHLHDDGHSLLVNDPRRDPNPRRP